eukprot:695882-Pleurochrysis_carterae.AAC.5
MFSQDAGTTLTTKRQKGECTFNIQDFQGRVGLEALEQRSAALITNLGTCSSGLSIRASQAISYCLQKGFLCDVSIIGIICTRIFEPQRL